MSKRTVEGIIEGHSVFSNVNVNELLMKLCAEKVLVIRNAYFKMKDICKYKWSKKDVKQALLNYRSQHYQRKKWRD